MRKLLISIGCLLIFFIGSSTLLLESTVKARTNLSAIARYAPFAYPALAGLLSGWRLKRVHGTNPDIGTATTPEDIWPVGGVYPWPAAAAITTISSSSINDDVGGTGCTESTVTCLDNDLIEIIEVKAMDGTTNVTLNVQCKRVNNVVCTASGSSEINEGDIDVKHGATVLSRIPIGDGEAQQSIFTVPAGKTFYVDTFVTSLQITKAAASVLIFQVKPITTGTWITKLRIGMQSGGQSNSNNSPPVDRPLIVPEKTDMRLRATFVDTNGMQINSLGAGFLVDNDVDNI